MPYSSLQQVMDEIEELVPFYQGIGYAELEMKGPYPAERDGVPWGTRRLYKGQFPSGFGRFSPVQYIPRAELSQEGYPLTLLTGTILYHSGTGSRSSRASRLERFQPEAFVGISEPDAKRLGISHGDDVKVVSPLSEVSAKAKIVDTVAEGMLFMPVSFSESPVNALFDVALDPRSKTPSLKACAVKLERIRPRG
jgi:predicted molibdopterin-dependent oxidoreductase YjgC